MGRRWQGRGAAIVLVAALAGCAGPGDAPPEAGRPFGLRFDDRPVPAAFVFEGPAVRDRAGGADGLWAVVPRLPRPERARIVNLRTGDDSVVALFAGPAGPVRLSNAAADAIGIAEKPVPVQVTALRSRPALDTTSGRF